MEGNLARAVNPPPKQMPELGRLKHATERLSIQAFNLEAFIARFHGSTPSDNGGEGGGTAEESYRNDLSSLFAQIERLEAAVSKLDTIG